MGLSDDPPENAVVRQVGGEIVGADGLEIEVHNCPQEAWSDGAQALVPEQFADVMRRIALIREAVTAELE